MSITGGHAHDWSGTHRRRINVVRLAAWALWPLTLALIPTSFSAATDSAGCRPAAKLNIPSTVSPQWRALYEKLKGMRLNITGAPVPHDAADWAKARKAFDVSVTAHFSAKAAVLTGRPGWKITHGKEGGIPVLIITPYPIVTPKEVLIYLHGGGYTLGSPRDELLTAALMANAAGLRMISVDYTLAPMARWRTVVGQVIAVYRAVLKQGYRAQDIGFFGDSAGGGLAAGATLAIRDRGLPMPGALVLWSPWTDLSPSGDTYETLKNADPALHEPYLQASADVYAPPSEQKVPYVSPVYGDFSKGFPPTLIQGGTKELLLSDFVRLYQAIETAGGTATLDIYEGMRHVFQMVGADTPESDTAVRRSAQFFQQHLGRRAVADSDVR